jgi:hypothetical protein
VLGALLVAIITEIVIRNYTLLRPHYTPEEISTADCQLIGAEELAGSEDLVRGRYGTLFISSGDLRTAFSKGNSGYLVIGILLLGPHKIHCLLKKKFSLLI